MPGPPAGRRRSGASGAAACPSRRPRPKLVTSVYKARRAHAAARGAACVQRVVREGSRRDPGNQDAGDGRHCHARHREHDGARPVRGRAGPLRARLRPERPGRLLGPGGRAGGRGDEPGLSRAEEEAPRARREEPREGPEALAGVQGGPRPMAASTPRACRSRAPPSPGPGYESSGGSSSTTTRPSARCEVSAAAGNASASSQVPGSGAGPLLESSDLLLPLEEKGELVESVEQAVARERLEGEGGAAAPERDRPRIDVDRDLRPR
jgi:hypothetical protein